MKFLGIIFDSKLTFQKHFEDILECCNNRYYCLRLLANKKWGPSPATLIQIYKQCVRPIFEYGSLSTITVSDNIISKIQWLQNKFLRLALCLPKYILPKLLHDSTGLPYVKDRLLTCATKSLDRIAQNPLVEASISSDKQILLGTVFQHHSRWSILEVLSIAPVIFYTYTHILTPLTLACLPS